MYVMMSFFFHAKLKTMLAGVGGGWYIGSGSTIIVNSYMSLHLMPHTLFVPDIH